jgi:hypothetical protein
MLNCLVLLGWSSIRLFVEMTNGSVNGAESRKGVVRNPTKRVEMLIFSSSLDVGSRAGRRERPSASFSNVPFLCSILKSPNSEILMAILLSLGDNSSLKFRNHSRALWSVQTV